MNSLKYIIPFLIFSSFIVDCNQTEGSDKNNDYKAPEKPVVQSRIDSVKYKAEIYRLDTLFTKLYKANVFNGNVLIAKGKDIIYQKSFGYSIKESNKLMDVIDDIYYDYKDDCIYITIKDLVKLLPKNSYDKLMDNLFNELKVYDSNFVTKTNYKII